MDVVPKLIDICTKYAEGKLVMVQAASLLVTTMQLSEIGRSPKVDILFNYLGYQKTPDEVKELEIGYNGDIEAWFTAGHRPAAWYMTRPEYMKSLKK